MVRITIASKVFCEFCHPMQGERKAFLKDIHIFLVKNENRKVFIGIFLANIHLGKNSKKQLRKFFHFQY